MPGAVGNIARLAGKEGRVRQDHIEPGMRRQRGEKVAADRRDPAAEAVDPGVPGGRPRRPRIDVDGGDRGGPGPRRGEGENARAGADIGDPPASQIALGEKSGKELARHEMARVKDARRHDEAEPCRAGHPLPAPLQQEMIGEEMDQRAQGAAPGRRAGRPAVQGFGGLDRVLHRYTNVPGRRSSATGVECRPHCNSEDRAMPSSLKEMLAAANAAVPRLTPEESRRKIAAGNVLVVDVRDLPELGGGKLKGAVHVSRGMLEFRADPESPARDANFEHGKTVLVYCGSGGRAALAGKTLKDLGYGAVYNAGGFAELVAGGLETEPG
jgi:rhodanese-related sulfurtransferase